MKYFENLLLDFEKMKIDFRSLKIVFVISFHAIRQTLILEIDL